MMKEVRIKPAPYEHLTAQYSGMRGSQGHRSLSQPERRCHLAQTDNATNTNAPGVMTGKPLIESDRVEGTAVYDPQGNHLGSIKRLMIEKISGKVAYAVMSFGGFLDMGEDEHTIPCSKLDYDTSLGGYRTDITEEQLRGAPTFYRDRDDYDRSDRERERELNDYWRTPYYWSI
jgi:hypothetical protein